MARLVRYAFAIDAGRSCQRLEGHCDRVALALEAKYQGGIGDFVRLAGLHRICRTHKISRVLPLPGPTACVLEVLSSLTVLNNDSHIVIPLNPEAEFMPLFGIL